MKKIAILVISCLALFITSPVFAVPIVSIQPSTQTVLTSEDFTFDIVISDVFNLSGWNIDINYDPSVISFNSITEGPFLSNYGTYTTIFGSSTPAANTVRGVDMIFDFFNPGASVSGSGVLATLSFTGFTQGITPLTLSNVTLTDPGASLIFCTLESGNVAVNNPVPEPSTILLLAIGLMGIVVIKKKRSLT